MVKALLMSILNASCSTETPRWCGQWKSCLNMHANTCRSIKDLQGQAQSATRHFEQSVARDINKSLQAVQRAMRNHNIRCPAPQI